MAAKKERAERSTNWGNVQILLLIQTISEFYLGNYHRPSLRKGKLLAGEAWQTQSVQAALKNGQWSRLVEHFSFISPPVRIQFVERCIINQSIVNIALNFLVEYMNLRGIWGWLWCSNKHSTCTGSERCNVSASSYLLCFTFIFSSVFLCFPFLILGMEIQSWSDAVFP